MTNPVIPIKSEGFWDEPSQEQNWSFRFLNQESFDRFYAYIKGQIRMASFVIGTDVEVTGCPKEMRVLTFETRQ